MLPPTSRPAVAAGRLPRVTSALAVCAHPDDESFGLGGVLHALGAHRSRIAVLCFTHGEASTLHGVDGDLAAVRARELAEAGRHLGAGRVELLGYPDGSLAAQPAGELARHVRRVAAEVGADALVVFDLGGVTGHPDHEAATLAALTAADLLDVAVLAWAVPDTVARTLNGELGTAFAGRARHEVDTVLTVDRRAQLAAIGCHASQALDNPVLRRRLELQGAVEWIRVLR